MPRPQFSLKTLLWLMAVVAVSAWAWASMEPMPRLQRAGVFQCIAITLGLIGFIARGSKRKKERHANRL